MNGRATAPQHNRRDCTSARGRRRTARAPVMLARGAPSASRRLPCGRCSAPLQLCCPWSVACCRRAGRRRAGCAAAAWRVQPKRLELHLPKGATSRVSLPRAGVRQMQSMRRRRSAARWLVPPGSHPAPRWRGCVGGRRRARRDPACPPHGASSARICTFVHSHTPVSHATSSHAATMLSKASTRSLKAVQVCV